MYLHIGGENLIFLKDIVMILNLDNYGQKDLLQEFVAQAESQGRLRGCEFTEAKSCIITKRGVYLSRISSHTLWKRRGL